MRILRFMAALIGLALIGAPAAGQTFPKFTGFVVDAANVLPPEVEADLTAKLEALQKDTHRQLIVATIPDLQGYPLEDYGYRLGREWSVGLKGVNNGTILFIAPNEPKGHRGPRIEVGYGLEPVITDALSSVIINTQMMPKLTNGGDIPGAMEAGTDALIAQLRASPDEAKARTDAAIAEFDRTHRSQGTSNDVGGIPFVLVFGLIVVAFIVLSRLRGGTRGRRYRGGVAPVVLWGPDLGGGSSGSSWSSGWGGGGSSSSDGGGWGGGGFTGGGGGSFGGGGASGDW
jgi:uncharacterized protein